MHQQLVMQQQCMAGRYITTPIHTNTCRLRLQPLCCLLPLHLCCSERHSLASHHDAQQAELQARLQEDLLAQRAALEGQQAVQQAQLDKERAVVRVSIRSTAAAAH